MEFSGKVDFEQSDVFSEDWEEVVFSEVIEINPKRNLKKGETAKFVSMADLEPFQRKVGNFITREFKGGSKFKNGDTLLARITPCLENGKTALVDILDDEEIGFGSTEFIVLSAKRNKTDPLYVYYLARSPEVRKTTIKSMTGTSGRQRVENAVFDNIVISLPSLPEQRAISGILSDLDSKIELNQRMNKILEATGEAIFRHWFVDFEFPNEEGKPYKSSGGEFVYDEKLGKEIPKKWKVKALHEISMNFDSKRVPLSSREREKIKGNYPYYGAAGILDYINDFIFEGTYVLMGEDGTVVDENGYPFLQFVKGRFWVNNHAHVLQGNGIPSELLYLLLKNTNVQHIVTGAVQPKINQANMNTLAFAIPDDSSITKLQDIIVKLRDTVLTNLDQAATLAQIRDLLLPRLMSGKIRVPVTREAVGA